MRASISGAVALVLSIVLSIVLPIVLAGATAAFAASRLTPNEVKTTFFDGKPFTASTPSGVKFKMVFSADGKVAREPTGTAGAKGEGTWKLDQEGFCTTWKGQKPNCFVVISAGTNKWSIMKSSTLMAVWSK
ncbi:hypothetical protein RA307_18215 [Xanthobacteraceae bacterium Astr-EGSB]|uniref:hypothetical protein n=1 Tax=Astrobacterium formosum TaxID=3069710 RepID=UPI0027B1727D|nr:hypothetical protein [Xanthobacteraceae bacterium Astr-EGSB]